MSDKKCKYCGERITERVHHCPTEARSFNTEDDSSFLSTIIAVAEIASSFDTSTPDTGGSDWGGGGGDFGGGGASSDF